MIDLRSVIRRVVEVPAIAGQELDEPRDLAELFGPPSRVWNGRRVWTFYPQGGER